jgi:asparaginyl-tRNA synthetase
LEKKKVAQLLNDPVFNTNVEIKGWVRTKRGSKSINFIALNDGTTIKSIQIVADVETIGDEVLKNISTGAALRIEGKTVESSGSGQAIEIVAEKIEIYGSADPETYPIQPKKHSFEFLRQNAHLRMRTNTFSAIMRLRHGMTFAIHQFFHSKGYYNLHTPIITASDAEGAGESFQVTNFDLNNVPKTEEGEIDFTKDFFGRVSNLTVSGQLEGELGAMALGGIYTFGPTFRD